METTLQLLLPAVVTAVAAYFLGCVNGAILMSKYVFHDDIRTHGSGNAGLTNFYRTFGTKGVVGVLLSDILKAVIAVLLGAVYGIILKIVKKDDESEDSNVFAFGPFLIIGLVIAAFVNGALADMYLSTLYIPQ